MRCLSQREKHRNIAERAHGMKSLTGVQRRKWRVQFYTDTGVCFSANLSPLPVDQYLNGVCPTDLSYVVATRSVIMFRTYVCRQTRLEAAIGSAVEPR